jgi:hypothetical protein
MKDCQEALLDDLAPKRKKRVIKKKFHSNKGVSVETAARRQAAAEAAQEDPLPKEQKDAISMKYGVKPAIIEREIKMPKWKAKTIFQLSERPVEVVWNHRMQDWYKETKGLTRNSARVYRPTQPQTPRLPEKFRVGGPKFNQNLRNQFRNPSPNSRRSSAPTDKSTKSRQS